MNNNQTADFLRKIWPDTGIFFLATKFVKDGVDTGAFVHHVVHTPEQAFALVVANSPTRDIWHAYSSYKSEGIPQPDGKIKRRTRQNVAQCRCFVWDVDIGAEEEKHGTKEAALADLERFLVDTSLPRPTDIVSSGSGIHLYWSVNEVLDLDKWTEVATKIKRVAIKHGGKLAADTTRIADAAGVLRPVGSQNHKAQPLPVEWLENNPRINLAELTEPLQDVPSDMIVSRVRHSQVSPHLAQFLCELPRTEIDFRALYNVCPQVRRHVIARGQVTEPDWYALAQLLGYVSKGDELFHKISEGDARYSYPDAQAKFDQIYVKDLGPTTCRQMAQVEPVGGNTCGTCPFAGRCHSPIQAVQQASVTASRPAQEQVVQKTTDAVPENGDTASPAEPSVALIPAGYSIETGKIEQSVMRDDGSSFWVTICDHVMYLEDITEPGTIGSSEGSMLHLRSIQNLESGQQIERLTLMPAKCMASWQDFYRVCLEKGVPVDSNVKPVFEYLSECRSTMLRKRKQTQLTEQFGWQNRDQFTTGGSVITKAEIRPAHLAPAIRPAGEYLGARSGSLEEWVRIFNIYVDGIEQTVHNAAQWAPYAFVAMTGFAAPLMKMTGQRCLTISLEGMSGIGKSAAMRLASSVWGKPNENTTKASDTVNYREQIIGAFGSLPIMYDEVTVEDDEYLREFIMKMTQGTGRNRLSSNADMKTAMHEWHTMVLMSANKEVSRLIRGRSTASNAESYRLLPIPMKRSNIYDAGKMRAAFRDLDRHHGLAGDIYARHLVANYDAIEQRVVQKMDALADATRDDSGAGRFWFAGCACVVVAAEITEELGLSKVKPGLLDWWSQQHVGGLSTEVTESRQKPADLLNELISANMDKMLQVTVQGDRMIEGLGNGMMRNVFGRVETHKDGQGNVIRVNSYLRTSVVHRAMEERSMHVADAGPELARAGILLAANQTINITAGTSLPPARVRCYQFDHSQLVGLPPAEAAAGVDTAKQATHHENRTVQ